MLRVLVAHNRYLQAGGEDAVFAAEVALLREYGHDVATWEVSNQAVLGHSPLRAAVETVWSRTGCQELRAQLETFRPDVVHFHNTFMRISPAAYYTCWDAGVPVVQTLHNYRLLCPAATFFRDGAICEACLRTATYWPSIRYGCWQGSRLKSAVVATMLITHRILQTWQRRVDCFIALSQFARRKFIEGGLPAGKIVVKPNFLAAQAPVPGDIESSNRTYALFVGRLSPEKGVIPLVNVWQDLRHIPLKIVGDGPLATVLADLVHGSESHHIELCGRLPNRDVIALMRRAAFLVFPSRWFEGFPMTLLEAFTQHTPVIAPRLGSIPEIVEDGVSGLLYSPDAIDELRAQVQWAWENPADMMRMGQAGSRRAATLYSAPQNYQQLMDIYRMAQANHRSNRPNL